MDAIGIIIGLSWITTSLVCIALAIPLARGRVSRNAIYGFRTDDAMCSDDAWMAINQFGGRRLFGWSVVVLFIGVTALFLPLRAHPIISFAMVVVPLALVLMPVVDVLRFDSTSQAKRP